MEKLRTVITVAIISLLAGCMSSAVSPKMGGLQRSLYPGLGTLDASQLSAAFKTRVDLHPPLTAGIVWLNDSRMWGPTLSEYARAGVFACWNRTAGRWFECEGVTDSTSMVRRAG